MSKIHPLVCCDCGYATTFVEWQEISRFTDEWAYVTVCENPACITGENRTLFTFNGQFGNLRRDTPWTTCVVKE